MASLPLQLCEAEALSQVVIDDIGALVRVESPSDDIPRLAASADAVSDVVERRLGLRPERLEVDGVTHLRLRIGGGPRRVLLLAHHDTVWPAGTLERLPWSVDAARLHGPGCFDMKTGLVSAIHAIAQLRARQAHAADGVTLLITGDEEVGSRTSRRLIEDEAAGCVAVFVLEAAGENGALKVGRKGASIYTVRIQGRAAHAGLEPDRGVNAAVEAAHQVISIVEIARPDLGTTVTPTVIRAGTTANTVPAEATVQVDVRATTTVEQRRVDDAMHGLTAHHSGCTITVDGVPNRPPMESGMALPLWDCAAQLAAELGLDSLRAVTVGGASDGNFTAGAGVPTLDGLGAVGGGAHADNEHVLVDFIPQRLALLTALIASTLGRTRDCSPDVR